jgi:hypothetical protein
VLSHSYSVREVIEHFVIGPTFADLNNFSPWQDIAVALPEISDVIHLEPCGRGQHYVR